jgi:hypothetical protein
MLPPDYNRQLKIKSFGATTLHEWQGLFSSEWLSKSQEHFHSWLVSLSGKILLPEAARET